MTSIPVYAQLAAGVYAAQRENRTPIPTGWNELEWIPDRWNGFSAGVYKNGNDIVIAFAGTNGQKAADFGWANLLAATGAPSPQATEAMLLYFQVSQANPTANITFTGHSLGGGIATMMSIFFNRPATVFDAAPFELGARNLVSLAYYKTVTAAAGYSDPAFDAYWAAAPTVFYARESQVTNTFLKGEFLESGRTSLTEIGTSTPVDAGAPTGVSAFSELHSMTLLAAMLTSGAFATAVRANASLIAMLFSKSLYATDAETSNERDFLTSLYSTQVKPAGAAPLLDRFANDLQRLGADGMTSQPLIQTALTVAAIEYYYFKDAISATAFLTTDGNGIHFKYSDIGAPSYKSLALLAKAVQPYLGTGENQLAGTAQLLKQDAWHIQSGTDGLVWTATDGSADAVIGGAGVDIIDAGAGNDMLIGSAGRDFLTGGTGDDRLLGGLDMDSYVFAAQWGKDVVADLDGQGVIQIDGQTLGQAKAAGGRNVWTAKLDDGQFVGLAVYDSSSSTGKRLVITRAGSTDNTITINNFDLTAAQGDGGYLGIKLQDTPELVLSSVGDVAVAEGNPFQAWDFDPNTFTGSTTTASANTFVVYLNQAATAGATLVLHLGALAGHNIMAVLGDQEVAADGATITLAEGQTQVSFALKEGAALAGDVTGALTVSLQGGEASATSNPWNLTWKSDTEADQTFNGDVNKLLNDAGTRYLLDGYGNFMADPDNPVLAGAPDVITGTGQADRITGLAGDDALAGWGGDDEIDGGDGVDIIMGGLGADTLTGGAGDDAIYGSSTGILPYEKDPDAPALDGWGTPIIGTGWGWITAPSNSFFARGLNPRYLTEALSRNQELGDAGNEIDGGEGNDHIYAGSGDDLAEGGAGNDQIVGMGGADVLLADAGDDLVMGDGYRDLGSVIDTQPEQQGSDFLDGGEGNDTLFGQGRNDEVFGGVGDDKLWGDDVTAVDTPATSHGDDYLDGEDGNDTLVGGGKDDVLYGGLGNDELKGDDIEGNITVEFHGEDYLDGEDGNDSLAGGGKDDALFGGSGNDTLMGDDSESNLPAAGHGNDYLDGQDGDDLLFGNGKDDQVFGGAGNDSLHGDYDDVAAEFQGDDYLDGEEGDDQLIGDGGKDTLFGGAGNDYLKGGSSIASVRATDEEDVLDGGAGDDVLVGDLGNDTLTGGIGNDYLAGSEGDDELDGGDGADVMFGEDGDDAAAGGAGNDSIYGGLGNDIVDGGEGDDALKGSAGDDILDGGDGNDILDGQENEDTVLGGGGTDVLWGGLGDDDLDGGSEADTLLGGEGADLLAGDEGNDQLAGQEGDDVLDGGIGNDIVLGGEGNDVLWDPEGNDWLQGDAGDDTLDGGSGADSLLGGDGNDLLEGGDGNDFLQGDGGSDLIRGGAGDDSLLGGIGNDTLDGGEGDDVYQIAKAVGSIKIAAGEGADKIVLSPTVKLSNVTGGVSETSVVLSLNGGQQSVEVEGTDATFRFADGSAVSMEVMRAKLSAPAPPPPPALPPPLPAPTGDEPPELRAPPIALPGGTITNQYDADGRLTGSTVTSADSGGGTITITYSGADGMGTKLSESWTDPDSYGSGELDGGWFTGMGYYSDGLSSYYESGPDGYHYLGLYDAENNFLRDVWEIPKTGERGSDFNRSDGGQYYEDFERDGTHTIHDFNGDGSGIITSVSPDGSHSRSVIDTDRILHGVSYDAAGNYTLTTNNDWLPWQQVVHDISFRSSEDYFADGCKYGESSWQTEWTYFAGYSNYYASRVTTRDVHYYPEGDLYASTGAGYHGPDGVLGTSSVNTRLWLDGDDTAFRATGNLNAEFPDDLCMSGVWGSSDTPSEWTWSFADLNLGTGFILYGGHVYAGNAGPDYVSKQLDLGLITASISTAVNGLSLQSDGAGNVLVSSSHGDMWIHEDGSHGMDMVVLDHADGLAVNFDGSEITDYHTRPTLGGVLPIQPARVAPPDPLTLLAAAAPAPAPTPPPAALTAPPVSSFQQEDSTLEVGTQQAEFDDEGQVAVAADAGAPTYTISMDSGFTAAVEISGATVAWKYDAGGHVNQQVFQYADGATLVYEYDLLGMYAGSSTSAIAADGSTVTLKYSTTEQLVGSSLEAHPSSGQTLTRNYNAAGVLTGTVLEVTDGHGNTTISRYDAADALMSSSTKVMTAPHELTVTSYDATGQVTGIEVTRVIDGSSIRTDSYGGSGNYLGSVIVGFDADGIASTGNYDAAGRLVSFVTSQVNADNEVILTTFDAFGRKLQENVLRANGEHEATSYNPDGSRLLMWWHPDGTSGSELIVVPRVSAGHIANQTATEDLAWSFAVAANTFADKDLAETLTYTATMGDGTTLPSWLSFDASTLTFSGTPADGDVGAHSIKLTATDSTGASGSTTFELNVGNVNDAPVVEQALDGQLATVDQPWTFTVPASTFGDVDADSGDALSWSATLGNDTALPSWLTFDSNTRTFGGTPAPGDGGDVVLKIIATDTDGLTVHQTIALHVDVPVHTDPGSSLLGSTANDILVGGTGNDFLNGLAGADLMIGHQGDDTYTVDTARDVVTEKASEGLDTVNSSVTYILPTNVETLVLTGSANRNGTGNASGNNLIGNTGRNTLTGAEGNDTINGGAGKDVLVGGVGNDTYLIARGGGADKIKENDATAGNTDVALFGPDITADQLWFQHRGRDLQVTVIGTSDKFTISNWFAGTQYHVEQFKTSDGKTLLDSQVQNLVGAMAGFAPPAAGQTTLSTGYQSQLGGIIAANWQ